MRTLIIGLTILATTAAAQGTDQVTLKYDDGTGVSGELVAFEDGIFRIQSSIGTVAIPAADVSCIGKACPEGTALEIESAAVTLTTTDGSFTVSGDVIEFADNEYYVATDVGELRVNADLVICEGQGCVQTQNEEPVDRTVSLKNGTTLIEGEYLRFEDGAHVIKSEVLGELHVDASKFECSGDACP